MPVADPFTKALAQIEHAAQSRQIITSPPAGTFAEFITINAPEIDQHRFVRSLTGVLQQIVDGTLSAGDHPMPTTAREITPRLTTVPCLLPPPAPGSMGWPGQLRR
jgi:hypothetical protein